MSRENGIYFKILTTPEYMGVLSGIIAFLFKFSQIGLLIGFGVTAILYTLKNKKTMYVKELFRYSGACGGFSLIITLSAWALLKEQIDISFKEQITEIVIWTIAQILEGTLIFFIFGLIISGIIVLLSNNKQISRVLKTADFIVNSPIITFLLTLGIIYLAKLYF